MFPNKCAMGDVNLYMQDDWENSFRTAISAHFLAEIFV